MRVFVVAFLLIFIQNVVRDERSGLKALREALRIDLRVSFACRKCEDKDVRVAQMQTGMCYATLVLA